MGTTPNYGWDYTDASDLLGAGFANDQTTAQQIDATVKANADAAAGGLAALGSSYVHCDAGSSADQLIANGTEAGITFGVVSAAAGWSQPEPFLFQYTGPPRLFLVTATVSVGTTGDAYDYLVDRRIVVNSAAVVHSTRDYVRVASVDPILSVQTSTPLTTVVGLADGNTIAVAIANSSGVADSVNALAAGRSLRITGLSLL